MTNERYYSSLISMHMLHSCLSFRDAPLANLPSLYCWEQARRGIQKNALIY